MNIASRLRRSRLSRLAIAASFALAPLGACTSAPVVHEGEVEPIGVTDQELGGNCTRPTVPICRTGQKPLCKCGICPRGSHGECDEEVMWCGCVTDPPPDPPAPPAPTQIAAGGSTTYARKDDGTVWGWGLGDSLALPSGITSSKPVAITGVSGAVQVTAGDSAGCARSGDGHIMCWGLLQSDPPIAPKGPTLVADSTGALTGMEGLAQGGTHACAWKAGQVFCWGDNTSGQLGDDSVTSRLEARVVPGLSGVTNVVMGQNATCVLAAGKVSCFGDTTLGQCGTGSLDGIYKHPIEVRAISGVTKLYGGGAGTFCADATVPATGTYCWGLNNVGQTGHGDDLPAGTPVPTTYAFGPGHAMGLLVSCTFTPGGAGSCWGNNANGELSNLVTATPPLVTSLTPISMTSTATVSQIAIGDAHMCVLSGTTVRCWGDDTSGQLGDGKTPASGPHPTAVDVAF